MDSIQLPNDSPSKKKGGNIISSVPAVSVLLQDLSVSEAFSLSGPFTCLELQDQEIGEFYIIQERCMTDFDDPKL